MGIPRITLRTNPLGLPARTAICSFDENADQQALAVQAAQSIVEITPGAIYILSNIAGRRITESIRWVLLDSLQEIVEGRLRTEYPENQDLLSSTFGELLGVALLCLEIGGQIEVIRLIENNKGKFPDFIIVQHSSSGDIAHLLECKGIVKDVNNVNRISQLDICQEMRSRRKDGKEQLDNIDLSQVKTGACIQTNVQKTPFSLPQGISQKYLSVVCVPDARMINFTSSKVVHANHLPCKTQNCIQCIKGGRNQNKSGLVSVIYREALDESHSLSQQLRDFLELYKACQKAFWARDDYFLSQNLLALIRNVLEEESQTYSVTIKLILLSFIEVAILEGVKLSEIEFEIEKLRANVPEEIENYIDELKESASRESDTKEIELVNIDGISKESLFDSNYLEIKRIFESKTNQFHDTNISIRGAIELFEELYEEIIVIRLFKASVNFEFGDLKEYVENLINKIRISSGLSTPGRIPWQEEKFSKGSQHFLLGWSWDEYPYPNSRTGFPGFTVWIAYDGRAEIIVRQSKK